MSSKALKAAATGQAAQPPVEDETYAGFKKKMELSKAQFLPLLGNNPKNVEAFMTVVFNAVGKNPDLLLADRRSLFFACMQAAQDGLLPDGREAVLNIYNTNVAKRNEPDRWVKMAQYLPMVQGVVKQILSIPGVVDVDACAVYAGEHFKYQRGDNPKIEHEPKGEGSFEDIIAAYCIVTREDGTKKREVVFRRDIDMMRAASKSPDKGPWKSWFDQMAIKSAIHRIKKQLPRCDALDRVLDSDVSAGSLAAPAGAADALDMGAPAPGAVAITDQSGQGMTFDAAAKTGERVDVSQHQETSAPAAKGAKTSKDAGGPKPLTYDEALVAVRSAKTKDDAEMAIDLARSNTTQDEKADLAALLAEMWKPV